MKTDTDVTDKALEFFKQTEAITSDTRVLPMREYVKLMEALTLATPPKDLVLILHGLKRLRILFGTLGEATLRCIQQEMTKDPDFMVKMHTADAEVLAEYGGEEHG